MTRILLISHDVRNLVTVRGDMLRAFRQCGAEVHVAVPETTEALRCLLSELQGRAWEYPLDRTGMNPLVDWKTYRALRRVVRGARPDAVFASAIKPVIYGSLASSAEGVSEIYSMISGLGYVFMAGGAKRALVRTGVNSLYRRSLSRNRRVFFQNVDDRDTFLEHRLVDTAKTVIVNGSGVNLDRFAQTPLPEGVSFLLVARLLRDKGVYEYAEAARIVKRHHPSIVFRIAGTLDSNPAAIDPTDLNAWIRDGVIEYLGFQDDVRPALAAASVYVLPSYREGTPLSVLEAMAVGRPIITTDAPGCRETVVDGENGFLVPVGDAAALADRMLRLAEDPHQLRRMASASRTLAEEKYDVRKVNAVITKSMGLG